MDVRHIMAIPIHEVNQIRGREGLCVASLVSLILPNHLADRLRDWDVNRNGHVARFKMNFVSKLLSVS